jgi:hypothetical protein
MQEVLYDVLTCKNLFKYFLNDCVCTSKCCECCFLFMRTHEAPVTPVVYKHVQFDLGSYIHYQRLETPVDNTEIYEYNWDIHDSIILLFNND